jgi:predicted esterase
MKIIAPHWLFALAALAAPFGVAADAPSGLQHTVVFTAYTPLAGSAEQMRRLLSPLTTWRMRQQLLRDHQHLDEQAIDLAQERFVLYVPPHPPPPEGYALLVFVPPWQETRVSPQWIPVLDRGDTILVSATHSGNDADVLNRREPLAILAAYNVMQRYHVDPQKVYVGGFSGGSRVALRLALAYPDLFRGALLEAGSDPIGSAQIPLPPPGLMNRFQRESRVVYFTGEEDVLHLAEDARSRESLKTWCVFDVDVESMRRTGHELADGQNFGRALKSLQRRATPDAGQLAACRAGIRQSVSAQLDQAEKLTGQGKPDAARKLLEQIDEHYGGLAAPRTVMLMQRVTPDR